MEFQESFLNFAPADKTKSPAASSVHHWHLFVDGASRGNPGPSGAGIYIECNKKSHKRHAVFLGTKTNNQAEYLALALGVYYVHAEIKRCAAQKNSLIVTSDSELLIKQMQGKYKVQNPILRQLHTLINELIDDLSVRFEHVLRDQNQTADDLANKAIDTKGAMPVGFKKLLDERLIKF